MFFGPSCSKCCNKTKRLVVTYDWSSNPSRDLDTGTTFLGAKLGYACTGASSYMDWNGDDTSASGSEIVFIAYEDARTDGRWSDKVEVRCFAGWYSPSEGTGSVTLRARIDQEPASEQSLIVSPGSQSGCAGTLVGVIEIRENGTFTLSSNPLP